MCSAWNRFSFAVSTRSTTPSNSAASSSRASRPAQSRSTGGGPPSEPQVQSTNDNRLWGDGDDESVALACMPDRWTVRASLARRTIRIIIPFPPGGTTDLIARRAQPLLERNLKTSIIIENRSGASGAIGTHAAVTSAPDGATFVLVFDTHGANPSLLANLPFDTMKDLAPVMLIGTSPMVITAHETAPYKSFADVIAAAKAKSDAVAY